MQKSSAGSRRYLRHNICICNLHAVHRYALHEKLILCYIYATNMTILISGQLYKDGQTQIGHE